MKEGVAQYHIKHLSSLVSEEFSASAKGKYLLSLFTDTDPQLKPEALKAIFDALEVKNLTPRLGELRMPVLTVNGEFDGALPRTREMSQKISGAVHQIVPGAGHACCLENPAVYDGYVRDFLRQHELMP
jgi:pimeloyl-ACP methyl ester carboxylesterase